MQTLENWQYGALAAAALLLGLLLLRAGRTAKRLRDRDFTRRLETVLKPRETVKTVCPEKGGRWVLTSERLLLEQGDAFFAIPFGRVKKVTGVDETGKATVAAAKMAVLTVHAEEEHVLHRSGEDFTDLVKGLKAGVSRERRKSAKPKKDAPANKKPPEKKAPAKKPSKPKK